MKRILTAVALSSVALLALAEKDACTQIAEAAEVAMEARQEGITMLELARSMDDAGVSASDKKFAMSIASMAYKHPIVQGKEAKANAIKEFGNEAYIGCSGG